MPIGGQYFVFWHLGQFTHCWPCMAPVWCICVLQTLLASFYHKHVLVAVNRNQAYHGIKLSIALFASGHWVKNNLQRFGRLWRRGTENHCLQPPDQGGAVGGDPLDGEDDNDQYFSHVWFLSGFCFLTNTDCQSPLQLLTMDLWWSRWSGCIG